VDKAEQAATVTDRPRIVELPEVRRAEETVLRLRALTAAQAYPAVIDLYHPDLQAALGRLNLLDTLSFLGPSFANVRVKLVEKQRTGTGILITLHGYSGGGNAVTTSYLLRRDEGRWKVFYDSAIREVLSTVVQNRVQQSLAPKAATPSPRAVAEGLAALRRYERVFASAAPDPAPAARRRSRQQTSP
jgi:hypothetical protein